jgi:hypothetical protein
VGGMRVYDVRELGKKILFIIGLLIYALHI